MRLSMLKLVSVVLLLSVMSFGYGLNGFTYLNAKKTLSLTMLGYANPKSPSYYDNWFYLSGGITAKSDFFLDVEMLGTDLKTTALMYRHSVISSDNIIPAIQVGYDNIAKAPFVVPQVHAFLDKETWAVEFNSFLTVYKDTHSFYQILAVAYKFSSIYPFVEMDLYNTSPIALVGVSGAVKNFWFCVAPQYDIKADFLTLGFMASYCFGK